MKFHGPELAVRYQDDVRDAYGDPAHAASYIRKRIVILDRALLRNPREHRRILLHEKLHFTWVRLGNPTRRSWEELLAREWRGHVHGEAGWSAEWRKKRLHRADVTRRSKFWREYCCESFCDTGACFYTPTRKEVTMRAPALARRREWFAQQLPKPLPI